MQSVRMRVWHKRCCYRQLNCSVAMDLGLLGPLGKLSPTIQRNIMFNSPSWSARNFNMKPSPSFKTQWTTRPKTWRQFPKDLEPIEIKYDSRYNTYLSFISQRQAPFYNAKTALGSHSHLASLPVTTITTIRYVEQIKGSTSAIKLLCKWCVQVLRSPKEALAAAMQSWRERCEKCVCLPGDYVEKWLHFQIPVVSRIRRLKMTRVHRNMYVVGSKSFRPDIQKPRQMENAVRDI